MCVCVFFPFCCYIVVAFFSLFQSPRLILIHCERQQQQHQENSLVLFDSFFSGINIFEQFLLLIFLFSWKFMCTFQVHISDDSREKNNKFSNDLKVIHRTQIEWSILEIFFSFAWLLKNISFAAV